MESSDPLQRAATSISAGGQQTLQRPPRFACADDTHEPFFVFDEPVKIGDREDALIGGTVRASGWQFDGDRTDVNDILSLIWGGVMRAFGIGSPWLIDEPHPVMKGELGARHLVFQQCPWKIPEGGFDTARTSLNAWTAFAYHLLNDVFRWDRGRDVARLNSTTVCETDRPPWAQRVSRYLRHPRDAKFTRRMFPLWRYLSSEARGITVVRMAKRRVTNLKVILTPFAPEVVTGEDAYAIFANGIPNGIPYKFAKEARQILRLCGEQWSGVTALPLDSHCLFIGSRTIVAVRGVYGREIFDGERRRLMARRSKENRVFFAEASIEWHTPVEASELEGLCLELIRREPGVVRAKAVGTTNDRDGGRDILIDWRVPNAHAEDRESDARRGVGAEFEGARMVRVIGQVKSRMKTIGKGDVRDIRDTVEHYDAEGFLLMAYPRLSGTLVDHLDKLGKTKVQTDWWECPDIEDRLRRHPDICERYPKVVTVRVAR